MAFKNSLAASGYIVSILGGGYGVHCFLQDKTIGDLLKRLGKVHYSEEDYEKAYNLFKDDQQFKTDISEINSLSLTSKEGGWELLRKYCDSKSKLPLNEKNLKEVLPKAQKYCLDFFENAVVSIANKNGLSWRDVKTNIVKKGISKNGQLFVSFKENDKEKGRNRLISYCWDTEKKDWYSSEGYDDCRQW